MSHMLQANQQIEADTSIWGIARMAFRQIAVMADMYLTVLGTAIVGLALVIFLDGFNMIRLGLTNSTGGMLATGMVVAVVGLFMLGIASEGPLRGHSVASPELNLVVARVIATLLVCLIGLWAASALVSVADKLDGPFEYIVQLTKTVSVAGIFVVAPFAIPGSWLLRRQLPQTQEGWDRLMILSVWFLAAFVILRQAISS